MTTPTLSDSDLARERAYLLGIAYRMLGSASDAEDIVQEALLRASRTSELRSMRAFLTTVVTRLCLDELGSARRRRETYVGPYLPEPVLTDGFDAPRESAPERRETVSLALLVLLDQLSPLERAVFVLREVFDLEFSEIAAALQRSESACRKLLQRARQHIASDPARPVATAEKQQAVGQAFFHALATGDLQALVELLAEDATLQTDHGGKASAARKAIEGGDAVALFLRGLAVKGARTPDEFVAQVELLNGAPSVVLRTRGGQVLATLTLRICESELGPRITRVSVMRNPDKLQRIARALDAGERLAVRFSND